jgi:hypothetical protein
MHVEVKKKSKFSRRGQTNPRKYKLALLLHPAKYDLVFVYYQQSEISPF